MSERAIWKGAIGIGMFLIPIKLSKAVDSHDVLFHEYHATDGGSVGRKQYCKDCNVDLASADVVKGYLPTKGAAPVTFTEAELSNIPVQSVRVINVDTFIDFKEVNPVALETSYYVSPEDVGIKPFTLLLYGLKKTNRVAVGKLTLRNREQACVIRPVDGAMLLTMLSFSDEIRKEPQIDAAVVSDNEKSLIEQVIQKNSGTFDHTAYKDTYTDAVKEMVAAKLEGKELPAAAPQPKNTQSLEEALAAMLK